MPLALWQVYTNRIRERESMPGVLDGSASPSSLKEQNFFLIILRTF
jgi:hypothetical protein